MPKAGYIRQNVEVPDEVVTLIRQAAGNKQHGAIQSFLRRGIELAAQELGGGGSPAAPAAAGAMSPQDARLCAAFLDFWHRPANGTEEGLKNVMKIIFRQHEDALTAKSEEKSA